MHLVSFDSLISFNSRHSWLLSLMTLATHSSSHYCRTCLLSTLVLVTLVSPLPCLSLPSSIISLISLHPCLLSPPPLVASSLLALVSRCPHLLSASFRSTLSISFIVFHHLVVSNQPHCLSRPHCLLSSSLSFNIPCCPWLLLSWLIALIISHHPHCLLSPSSSFITLNQTSRNCGHLGTRAQAQIILAGTFEWFFTYLLLNKKNHWKYHQY